MIIEGVVGAQIKADGSVTQPRLGRLAEVLTGDSLGKYYELCRRGQIFMASMQAGASLGTALTATAVTVTLYNPLGSGINVALLQCAVALTVPPTVTVATANLYVYAGNVNTAAAIPSTVTALTIQSGLLGGGVGQAKAYSAATLPATPVVVRIFPFGQSNQTAVGDGPTAAVDYVDGALCLQQNTAVTLQSIGAANSGIVSMTWAEIPV
jgi:hypothetical protein